MVDFEEPADSACGASSSGRKLASRSQSTPRLTRGRSLYDQARVVSEEVEVLRGRFSRLPRVELRRADGMLADFDKGTSECVKLLSPVYRTLQLEGALLSAHDVRADCVNSLSPLWELNVRDVKLDFDAENETIHVPFSRSVTLEYKFDDKRSSSTFGTWRKALETASQSTVEMLYSLENQIGTGAYAKVYRATGKKTGKRYAVKVIEKNSTNDAFQFEFLSSEVRVMRTVLHPQLITTFDIFDNDDALRIVLPYMEGGELFDRVAEKGRFSELNAQQVMRDILRGVHYLHMLDITHHDIKPENVLCESKDWPLRPVLCDFGLSSISADSSDARGSRVVGTVAYVAPEKVRHEETSKAVDLWSCGVMLYLMLSGKTPFAGKDDEEVLSKISKGSYAMMPRDWRKISPQAKSLVKALLQSDPRKRLSAAGALQHQWIYADDVTDEPIENDLSALHSSRRRLRKAVLATTSVLKLTRGLRLGSHSSEAE